jgi:hypothetical protein
MDRIAKQEGTGGYVLRLGNPGRAPVQVKSSRPIACKPPGDPTLGAYKVRSPGFQNFQKGLLSKMQLVIFCSSTHTRTLVPLHPGVNVPGATVPLVLEGTEPFKGLLVYAVNKDETKPLGEWGSDRMPDG